MMSGFSRRTLLTTAAATGGVALVGVRAQAQTQADDLLTVGRDDPRYASLTRGQNQRWESRPDAIVLPRTTDDVVRAARGAVAAGKRISVRGGGHCYEDFVDNAEIQLVIDMSRMRAVTFDSTRNAFMVEGGATLGEAYHQLYRGWGVTLPGGACHTVGVGGHVSGGGYGNLSRQHGLVVDHLHAVEVVTVDAAGEARAIVATNDPKDPHQDLWWAHTGGGGGTFGVITRYWFRSPGATTGPLLPTPPTALLVTSQHWPWATMTETRFATLLTNYGTWCEKHSAPTDPNTAVYARLEPAARPGGPISLAVEVDASAPNAHQLLKDFLAAVNNNVGITPTVVHDPHTIPFLQATGWPGLWSSAWFERYKYKSSYHRKALTPTQTRNFYKALTETDYNHPGYVVSMATHGGKINTPTPTATAQPHRDSVMKLLWGNAWSNAREDTTHITYIRNTYKSVYADTGGVPTPNTVTDGCYISYADTDLSNPTWNASTVPWHDLYWPTNYPRLQKIKTKYDPKNIFRNTQSVRPA